MIRGAMFGFRVVGRKIENVAPMSRPPKNKNCNCNSTNKRPATGGSQPPKTDPAVALAIAGPPGQFWVLCTASHCLLMP